MIYWVHELAHGPNWKLAADTQGYAVTQFGSAHFKVKLINSSVYSCQHPAGGNCRRFPMPLPQSLRIVTQVTKREGEIH